MQRYFLDETVSCETVTVCGDDARHISRVMRMQPGDPIICCGPDGRCAQCEILELEPDYVVAAIKTFLDESPELPVHVTIAQGLPKGDKLDLIVQKGTELGANAFLPFEAERSIVKWDRKKRQKKTERLGKIAKEAAEQSHRNRIPGLNEPVTFKELLSRSSSYNIKLIAYEEEAKAGESGNFVQALRKITPGDSMLVVIGPEGGLSEKEISALEDTGFIACGLGPRILRTETAALYLLAAMSYQFELLG
ncbi:MAG TPA: 16S rRNA (uracil(1498)-N(3))-methyltransferase [Bacillales bacterium]|nr:16S rRNA (uracil(1498)-N(3))-methyltransferase [Bacillales bacterium]